MAQSETYYKGQSMHRLVCESNALDVITDEDREIFDNFTQRGRGYRNPTTGHVTYF